MSKQNPSPSARCACAAPAIDDGRRQWLTRALTIAALAPLATTSLQAQAQAQAGSRGNKPEPGDLLAHAGGPNDGQTIVPADLKFGDQPTLAYPVDPRSGEVLVSRAGMLTLIRLRAEDLKSSSAARAADGIVAFSSLCTHYGCPITTLHPSQTQIVCNCHGSVFDASDRGTVTTGPAVRRLAMLPLSIADGALRVAGKFDGPIGPPI